MSAKFYALAIGEVFYIDETPKTTTTTLEGKTTKTAAATAEGKPPARVLIPCRKASSITYVVIPEETLGEVSYDPDIAEKITTAAELQAVVEKAVTLPAPKGKPAKKAVRKPAKKALRRR